MIIIYIAYKKGKFTQMLHILGQLTRTIQIFFLLLPFFYTKRAFFLRYEKTYLQEYHYFLMPRNQKPGAT